MPSKPPHLPGAETQHWGLREFGLEGLWGTGQCGCGVGAPDSVEYHGNRVFQEAFLEGKYERQHAFTHVPLEAERGWTPPLVLPSICPLSTGSPPPMSSGLQPGSKQGGSPALRSLSTGGQQRGPHSGRGRQRV